MHNKVPFTKFNQDSTVRRTLENKVMVPMMRMKRMLMMTILISMTKMNDEEKDDNICYDDGHDDDDDDGEGGVRTEYLRNEYLQVFVP